MTLKQFVLQHKKAIESVTNGVKMLKSDSTPDHALKREICKMADQYCFSLQRKNLTRDAIWKKIIQAYYDNIMSSDRQR